MVQPPYSESTRTTYDTVAQTYADRISDELDRKPWDRALLSAFAEAVGGSGARVADVGCGPGHVTAHLASLGLDSRGIDLSPGMIAAARAAHPEQRYDVGSMLALELGDDELAGIVAFYSIIHVADDDLAVAFGEFRRVLRPGGLALLAFQVGPGDSVHLDEWFGHEVSIDFHRRTVEHVVAALEAAGLAVTLRLVREPEPTEQLPRAYLLARSP